MIQVQIGLNRGGCAIMCVHMRREREERNRGRTCMLTAYEMQVGKVDVETNKEQLVLRKV